MVCESCNNSKKSSKDFTRAVIEINNPDKLVLLRKVVIPASMGTKDDFPPTIGKYYNTLLQYEANGDLYLYSSDGIPTQLSSDVSELQHQLEQLGLKVDKEILDRIAADAALNNSINAVSGSLSDEVSARQDADTTLQNNITALDNSLATVAKSGSYNDLSNKPTIGNATLTIKKNGSNVGTFTANATTNKNIDISVPTKTSNLVNDGSDGASQYVESDDLATVATSGSYNDLSNKPTIGNATLTIKRNDTSAGTFTANATTNKSINIAVPTKTSDLTNDGSDGTSTYVETKNLPTIGNATLTITENNTPAGTFTANATSNKTINITSPTKTSDLTNDGADGTSTYVESDDLPTVDTTYSSSSSNAIANSTVTNSLDRSVMTNLTLDSTPSTTTVNLNNTKTNLAHPSSTTTSSISLPVASSTQAGVMNSSTFDAIASNTSNINAILNGAVAITGLPASPTQAELTTAWENETGLTSLMNRAGIYDVTNSKVWTYYTNDNTWYAATNTSQVTVSTFTNSSEGLIKGSTNDGQVFAENDGTGSVNGWDTLTSAVSSNTSKLATIAQGAEVNVQANWTQTNTNADDYIKNKPSNLVQDANYVHTDNNFTTTLKDKLNGISAGAEVNVQADWTQTNTGADDYIKNKPANLVQDANYVHTDNNFTTTLKNKLDGIESGAEANVQADWTQSNTSADDYIKNKPTIPTVNNATLTIQKNGTNIQTFTANSSTNKTANITVPTAVSELTNDANYVTTTQLNDGLATKQNTLTAGSNITINNDTISATDTTYTAGNAIDITNNVISADVYPADFFTAGETVSGEGTDITLNNTISAPLESVELNGDTYQQTYSGANLFNVNTITPPTGVTINADGSITCVYDNTSGSSTLFMNLYTPNLDLQTSTTYAAFAEIMSLSGGGTLALISGNSSASQFTHNKTFNLADYRSGDIIKTTDETKADFSGTDAGTRTYVSVQAGLSLRLTFRMSVIADTTVTPEDFVYQPYVGGTPSPNPDYPQDVQVVTGEQTVKVSGKNLFDANNPNIINAYIDDTHTTITSNDVNRIIWIPCKPNTTYSFTKTAANYKRQIAYTTVEPAVGVQVYGMTNGLPYNWTTKTYTTGNNAKYLLIRLWSSSQDSVTLQQMLNSLQIEQGSTATAYEPYQSQTYPISLGSIELCKIGDYQDYIYRSGGDWYVHKECGNVVLDGSDDEGWIVASYDRVRTSSIFGLLYNSGSSYGYYANQLVNANSETVENSFNVGASAIFLKCTSKTSSVANWKTWLSSNNLIIYAPLATSTDTKITDSTLIGQLEALRNAKTNLGTTSIVTTATGTNLPVILDIAAYRKSLNGVLESIPDAQVQSNWAQADSTAVDYIKNKPSLATVATTGSYNDLTDKPTIPVDFTSAEWNNLWN